MTVACLAVLPASPPAEALGQDGAEASEAQAPPPARAGAPAPDPAHRGHDPVAILPFENLSGTKVPLGGIRLQLARALEAGGVQLLDEDSIERFMAAHRIRWTGGVASEEGRRFAEETGVRTILVASVDNYDDGIPPKLAMTVRLVSAGPSPSILWMESRSLAGHQSPGPLALGVVNEMPRLRAKLIGPIADSLAAFVAAGRSGAPAVQKSHLTAAEKRRRYRPRHLFRSPSLDARGPREVRLAVLPFANDSATRDAGDLVALHFVRHLARAPGIEVLEPGVVRQALLQGRVIMEGGSLSIPQADLLRALLNVDLVVTGNVTEYREYRGPWGRPEVVFSARVIDAAARQLVFASFSYNDGEQGVFFFDWRRVHTAQELASAMARQAVLRFLGRPGG